MNKKILVEKIFIQGTRAGLKDMEVFCSSGRDLTLKVFNKEIDSYSLSQSEGLSFRGMYNGKMGYSYTEKVDDSSIELIIKEAIENAEIIDSDDKEEIFEGSKEYKEVNNYNPQLELIKEKDKINFAKKIEEEAFKVDERVSAVQYCVYGDGYGETLIANTKGLFIEDKGNLAYAYVVVVVKEGEDVKTGFSFRAGRDFSKFNPAEIANEAVDKAIKMLGAKSIKSGDYPIIIKNNSAVDLLESFTGIFSAENVQKDLSILKGKIDTKIASDYITIIDDPFMEEGLASKYFDGEGAACKYKKVIDKGVLKTYLHNLKTAKKDGVETTGNASKPSYKASVDISPSNMYIQKGDKSLEDMIRSLDRGILINNLEGLHSGLNSVSGDFSLSASGFLIENGNISRPVKQITVAGNFFEMIQNILEIGNDLEFGLPGESYIGSPSLKIKHLAVAGE